MSSLENALRSVGLNFSTLIMDGELHRCSTVAKPRKENGWYIIYEGGAAACYGNWEDGDSSHTWRGENVSDEVYSRVRASVSKLKEQREAEQLALADTALEFWESCARTGYSDYLKKKGVQAHGLRFDGNTLIMSLQDATGKIWSYQKIYGNSDKYFLQGARVRGCYYIIGVPVDKVIVCEGFATGATIYEETGVPVIVSLFAGNLKAVCDSIPFRDITIAADNDAHGRGEKAAKESGYPYVIPTSQGDFNDIPRELVRGYFVEDVKISEDIRVHGLVGEIADWITATAIRPQPLLSLAAALSFVGMIKGHRVEGYTNLRTNLMILAMAPTGGGKEHPQNAIKRLVKACGLQKHLMGEFASGSGFLHSLQNAGGVGFMVMDEVGRYIGNLSSQGAGVHQREILDYMIKTFSCANSILMGREKAAAAKEPRIDIDQPHFCCYGSTVYEKFRDACGSGEIVDGFLNRWIFLESKERPDRQKKVKFSEPPQSIIDKVQAIISHSPYDSYGVPKPETILFTPEAWEIYDAYRDKVDAMVKTAPYPLNQLINRAPEHIEKIAHTIAEDGCTGIYDLRAAIKIVEFSNDCIARFAGMISDNNYERDFVRVREIMKEMKIATRSGLLRRCQFVQGGAKRVAEIMGILVEENMVAHNESGKKVTYKWIERF
jgi:hypothetical protein